MIIHSCANMPLWITHCLITRDLFSIFGMQRVVMLWFILANYGWIMRRKNTFVVIY